MTETSPDPARVLIVEDESLIAMLLEQMLEDLGHDVLGPAQRVSPALALLAQSAPDMAILDVNVAGEPVFPVAEALEARGIPFAFATGYGDSGVPPRWNAHPVLPKPFRQAQVQALVDALLRPGG